MMFLILTRVINDVCNTETNKESNYRCSNKDRSTQSSSMNHVSINNNETNGNASS